MSRRGRVGRGGRIIIDRLSEPKPLFGNVSHEIYRGTLPMGGVRYTPRTKGPTGSHLPDLPSLDAPASNMVMAPVAFNRCPPEKSSMKRSYQEVMPTETALPYCNIDTSLSFNLASEMIRFSSSFSGYNLYSMGCLLTFFSSVVKEMNLSDPSLMTRYLRMKGTIVGVAWDPSQPRRKQIWRNSTK